jgi:hypothetical protein
VRVVGRALVWRASSIVNICAVDGLALSYSIDDIVVFLGTGEL